MLYASAQNVAAPQRNWVTRFDAATGAYLGSFRISDSTAPTTATRPTGSTPTTGTSVAAFPNGLFVCQDGFNDAPGTSGTQNFKYAPLHLVDGVA